MNDRSVQIADYEQWLGSFARLQISRFAQDLDIEDFSADPRKCEEYLTDNLRPHRLYDIPGSDDHFNPPVPWLIASVVADYDAAAHTVAHLYHAMLANSDGSTLRGATVRAGLVGDLEDLHDPADRSAPGLIDSPFFVVGLLRQPRQLLFYDEIFLNHMTADDAAALKTLHRRISNALTP